MGGFPEKAEKVSAKEVVSRILYEASKKTWENRKGRIGEVISDFDDFSGGRSIDVSGLPKGSRMNLGFDGNGTKIEAAERMGCHRTAAFDLLAMVCDDAVVRGAEPVLIGSTLDVKTLTRSDGTLYLDEINQLAEGYVNAAKAADVIISNGEVGELGARVSGYGEFNYNWGAGLVWFAKKERMFTGREIKKGDYLVGLLENGFRSNGLSLVRKILAKEYGPEWHKVIIDKHSLGELVLTPSVIYCSAICDMFGGYDREPRTELHGVAHITSGGVPEKLGRVLKPSGLGAVINDPIIPINLVLHLQKIGNVSDEEAYRTLNMGQGMIVISPKPDEVRSIAAEHGIGSRVIGEIVESPGIKIDSRGYQALNDGKKELVF